MLLPGHATLEGTARFRSRFASQLPEHFREAQGLWVSSIGIGTYLGEPTAAYDALYREAVAQALESGINDRADHPGAATRGARCDMGRTLVATQ